MGRRGGISSYGLSACLRVGVCLPTVSLSVCLSICLSVYNGANRREG